MRTMKAVDSKVLCPCVEANRGCMHKLHIRKLDRDRRRLREPGRSSFVNISVPIRGLMALKKFGTSGPNGKPERD